MSPRRTFEEKLRFDSFIRSSSDNRDKSRGPSITINRDRYNSVDGPLRLYDV